MKVDLEIKKGATRTVFLIFGLAIKTPSTCSWKLFLCGLLGNMQESLFSKTKNPWLCPVLFSIPGGWLIVMRRARSLTFQEFESTDIKAWLDSSYYTIPTEIKIDSFGKLNGKLVVIDYGS